MADEFLISPGMLGRNRIHLFAGSPYAGKSTLLAQILSCLIDPSKSFLSGLSFSKVPVEEIGIIFTDRRWDDNATWLTQLGLESIAHYSLADDLKAKSTVIKQFNESTAGVELFKFCLQNLPPRCKIIVVDVFTTCFLGKNIQDQYIVHKHMIQLLHLCQEYGITIIGTAYGSKQKGKQDRYVRLVDRIIGAATLRGCATDLAYLATKEETGENEYQEFHWISRHTAPRSFAIARDKVSGFFVEREDIILEPDIISNDSGNSKVKAKSITSKQQVILNIIPYNKEFTITEIVEIVSPTASQATVYRAIQRFIEVGALSPVVDKSDTYIRKLDS